VKVRGWERRGIAYITTCRVAAVVALLFGHVLEAWIVLERTPKLFYPRLKRRTFFPGPASAAG